MPNISSPTPDATTATKGKVQLAGVLSGTAASPTLTMFRQNDTTNTTSTGVRIESGWGYMLGNNTIVMTKAIVFNSTFTNPPIVFASCTGYNTSVPTSNGGNLQDNNVYSFTPQGVSNGGYTLNMARSSSTFANTLYYIFNWVAIGA